MCCYVQHGSARSGEWRTRIAAAALEWEKMKSEIPLYEHRVYDAQQQKLSQKTRTELFQKTLTERRQKMGNTNHEFFQVKGKE